MENEDTHNLKHDIELCPRLICSSFGPMIVNQNTIFLTEIPQHIAETKCTTRGHHY